MAWCSEQDARSQVRVLAYPAFYFHERSLKMSYLLTETAKSFLLWEKGKESRGTFAIPETVDESDLLREIDRLRKKQELPLTEYTVTFKATLVATNTRNAVLKAAEILKRTIDGEDTIYRTKNVSLEVRRSGD